MNPTPLKTNISPWQMDGLEMLEDAILPFLNFKWSLFKGHSWKICRRKPALGVHPSPAWFPHGSWPNRLPKKTNAWGDSSKVTILVIPYSWGCNLLKGHLEPSQENAPAELPRTREFPSVFLPEPAVRPSCASRRAIRRSFLRRFRSPGSHKWQKAHCSWREIRGK